MRSWVSFYRWSELCATGGKQAGAEGRGQTRRQRSGGAAIFGRVLRDSKDLQRLFRANGDPAQSGDSLDSHNRYYGTHLGARKADGKADGKAHGVAPCFSAGWTGRTAPGLA